MDDKERLKLVREILEEKQKEIDFLLERISRAKHNLIQLVEHHGFLKRNEIAIQVLKDLS